MQGTPEPHKSVLDAIRPFLNEEQDPEQVKPVYERVQQILTEGESITYIAIQKKPLITIAPDSFVLTSRRFIAYRPRLLGQVSFDDHLWRDLRDAQLKEGIFGAKLTFKTTSGASVAIDYLPKAQARKLYALAQRMEERVREERRTRELEEMRAKAGGVVLHGAGTVPSPQSLPPDEAPIQRLKALKEMFEADLISTSEYDAKRAEIISKM
jgi:hypothetical protein